MATEVLKVGGGICVNWLNCQSACWKYAIISADGRDVGGRGQEDGGRMFAISSEVC